MINRLTVTLPILPAGICAFDMLDLHEFIVFRVPTECMPSYQ
jgi:hypothetical protein